ncbi:MAG: FtsH protease activity modulator HflK [Alphaproteobacteria bacterium]
MPWNNQTGGKDDKGGPWGSGNRGNNQNPWGRGPSGPQGPQGPNNSGPKNPIDFEEMLKRSQDKVKRVMPGGIGGKRGILAIAVLAVVVWLATGFYRVEPNQVGVELVFGKMTSVSPQGLHYNWPAPIGDVQRPNVTTINSIEVGMSAPAAIRPTSRTAPARTLQSDSLMLTGDENILDIQAVVLWRVDMRNSFKGVENYLFNIRDPDRTVKDVAEAALREVIGKNEFEFIRTQGRVKIQLEVMELMQRLLDEFGAGVEIREVQMQRIDPPGKVLDAFRDVQAARADKERVINEANAYFNQKVQGAEGQSETITRSAEAYKEERVALATGEASRFLALYAQYQIQKDITRQRLYLDTMREVMRSMDKTLIDNGKGSNPTVPYLPLNELMRKQAVEPVPGSTVLQPSR